MTFWNRLPVPLCNQIVFQLWKVICYLRMMRHCIFYSPCSAKAVAWISKAWMILCMGGAWLLTLMHLGEGKEQNFRLSSEHLPWVAWSLTANSPTLSCCTHIGSKFHMSSCQNSWRYYISSTTLQGLKPINCYFLFVPNTFTHTRESQRDVWKALTHST